MKLSVGDIVRIKSKEQLLEIANQTYGSGSLSIPCAPHNTGITFNEQMFEYCKKVVTIIEVMSENRYHLDIDKHRRWTWVEEFFDVEGLIL